MEFVWVNNSPTGSSMETTSGARILERACAECRRSKSHCDRRVPCTSCSKKGLRQICPANTLTSAESSRRGLNTTVELREKSNELSSRIFDLEQALRASHALMSTTRHPLLADHLLALKEPFIGPISSPGTPIPVESTTSDRHGTLAVYPDGRTQYYGPSASSWSFWKNEAADRGSMVRSPATIDMLPQEVQDRAASFSQALIDSIDGSSGDPQVWIATLRCYLPALEEAQRLFALYFEFGASYSSSPLPIQQAYGELIPAIYENYDPFAGKALRAHHEIGLLFSVCAVATMLDPAEQPQSVMAAQYHALSRAALVCGRLLEFPTCEAIQSLLLVSSYQSLISPVDCKDSVQWVIMGTAVRLSHMLGLHRDPSLFSFSEAEARKRRRVYMAAFTQDARTSLQWNLPPCTQRGYVAIETSRVQNPNLDDIFMIWRFAFSRDCFHLIHEIYSERAPAYSRVLDIDNKIRSFDLPPAFRATQGSANIATVPSDSPALVLARTFISTAKEAGLFLLHRQFVFMTISRHPEDPLRSTFGASVQLMFNAAKAVITLVQSATIGTRHPLDRMWYFVDLVFTVASAIAAVLIRCPNVTFAQDALNQLDASHILINDLTARFQPHALAHDFALLRNVAHARCISILPGATELASDDLMHAEELLQRLGLSTRLNQIHEPHFFI